MDQSGSSGSPSKRLVLERLSDVIRRVPMCRSKLYAEIAGSRFPRPVKVGRTTAFVSSEVDAWISMRIAERVEGKANRPQVVPDGEAV